MNRSGSAPFDELRSRRDVEALEAALAASQVRATASEARAVAAEAKVSDAQAQIAALTLMIEKLRRALYGRRSERAERLLGQLELELDELSASAAEDALTTQTAPGRTTQVKGFERRRPSRKPFPEHLPRERVVVASPETCTCCGSKRLSKVGEDVTETLEVIPRQWKVIQTVREKFTCRDCEKLSQAPAPYHAVPRGWAGPNLLATIVYEKYGQHQPLNRQSERYAREGVELSISTLADQVGACVFALRPLHELIGAHVLAAQRLHGALARVTGSPANSRPIRSGAASGGVAGSGPASGNRAPLAVRVRAGASAGSPDSGWRASLRDLRAAQGEADSQGAEDCSRNSIDVRHGLHVAPGDQPRAQAEGERGVERDLDEEVIDDDHQAVDRSDAEREYGDEHRRRKENEGTPD